jgi:hypothetical protein
MISRLLLFCPQTRTTRFGCNGNFSSVGPRKVRKCFHRKTKFLIAADIRRIILMVCRGRVEGKICERHSFSLCCFSQPVV